MVKIPLFVSYTEKRRKMPHINIPIRLCLKAKEMKSKKVIRILSFHHTISVKTKHGIFIIICNPKHIEECIKL